MSSTCTLSGIAAPDVVTLAALASGDDSAAVIVSPDCSETQVDATASEDPSEFMINASYAGIQAVASYPKVANLYAPLLTMSGWSCSELMEMQAAVGQPDHGVRS
jgi:hypothetical protein